MTQSIAAVAARFKRDPNACLDEQLIRDAAVAAGHRWRQRVLDPVTTVYLILLQVAHGNCACRTLPHLAELDFSVAAFCDARARLPLDLFIHLAGALIDRGRQATHDASLWLGHRIFLTDGTGISMPDAPALQKAFGQPGAMKPGCGFPVMHLLVLVDCATGLLTDLVTGPCNTHDAGQVDRLHPSLRAGDVLVGDRAFCSYTHLAMLQIQGIFGVFRLHQRINADFTPGRPTRRRRPKTQRRGAPTSRWIRSLGRPGGDDQLVEYHRPSRRANWISQAAWRLLPATLVVRELRYTLARPGFRTRRVTLATTLLDPEAYPKHELVRLYGLRWRVETDLRHLKQTLGLDVLKCKSADGVMKELWAFVIVYNLVRMMMVEAASRQGVEPNRVSFIDALDALRHANPHAPPPTLVVNPRRPGRDEPRVIKRRKDRYTYMTRPRDELRQALGITRLAA